MQTLQRDIRESTVPSGIYLSSNVFVTTQATAIEIDSWLKDNATWNAAITACKRFQCKWQEYRDWANETIEEPDM